MTKKHIAALTIALLISACKEAQTGMTVETVYLFQNEEDFTLNEVLAEEGHYYHQTTYDVPEITQAAWEGGTVIVHHCIQDRGIDGNVDAILDAARGRAAKIEPDAPIEKCNPFRHQNRSYGYSAGKLEIGYGLSTGADRSPLGARLSMLDQIAGYPVLRVTIIAPAE